MQETQVQPPHQEDALEEEMATHSSILARKIPWTEEPGKLQSTGSERSPGGGNDNLLTYSCQKNPMDRGAWWATAQRVVNN